MLNYGSQLSVRNSAFSLVNQNQTIHNSKPEKNKFDLLIGWHVFSKLIDWTEI